MKRFFDFNFALILIILLLIPMMVIAIFVRLTSTGPALYWSERVGRNNIIFKMPKFRSMWEQTPPVATHLVKDHHELLSPIGDFLRKTSLDELPQLYSVLVGDMSFVGPRPALFNQDDLISLRNEKGVDKYLPGITGLAQINGRDDLSIKDKVALDQEYIERRSFFFDLRILFMTLSKVIKRDNVSY